MIENDFQNDLEIYAKSFAQDERKRKKDCVVKFFAQSLPLAFWEKYLEREEVGVQGLLFPPKQFSRLIETISTSIWDLSSESSCPDFQREVAGLISNLSSKQRQVIELYYFEGKSEYEIAYLLGKSQGTIHQLKERGLNRIESGLAKKPFILSIIEAQKTPKKDIFDQIDELFLKGAISKDEFYHLWALAEVGGLKAGAL